MRKSDNQEFVVFTVCNIAYLPKALVLADSLMKFSGQKLHVVVFDCKQDISCFSERIEVIWVEDLGVPRWRELAFMYDIIEFSTSLKPFIALKLLERHKEVIFLDPDTAIFSPLDSILTDLETHPVILTPHYTKPQPDTQNESDLGMMRFGSFNLGFFAVKQGREAESFLKWWSRRCIDFCFMESQFGLSTDQKWVSIAPCFFDFLKISFNPGYNAAPWNTFEREITSRSEGKYIVNDKHPLVFFHFSNFDHDDPQYLNKRASSEVGVKYPLLEELGQAYSSKLKEYETAVPRIKYSYDYMSDDSYISPTLRKAYVSVREKFPPGSDPFDISGPIGVFAKNNALLVKQGERRYSYPTLKEAENHQGKLKLVYLFMRFVLKIYGPNRFYDLSKLFVYLSVYRKNSDFWKF